MLLCSQFMPSNTFQEFERLLTEKLTPMFSDLLGIGDNIPMRVIDTYIRGENGGGVVDYLKDGDNKVEEEICMVTKFLGFNDAKSEMQVPPRAREGSRFGSQFRAWNVPRKSCARRGENPAAASPIPCRRRRGRSSA